MSDTAALAVPALGEEFPDVPVVLSDASRTALSARLPVGRPAVVFFMRSPDCPVCRSHIRALQRMADAGELSDAAVVIVVPGGAAEAALVQDRTRLPVVASGEAHRAAGLGRFLLLQHSGTFVLDPDRRILARRTSALPTSSFSRAEVIAALRD